MKGPSLASGAYKTGIGGSLAAVAFSGQYSDLLGKPTLGTASAQDVGYFATAAQGLLASTALQPGAQIPWTDVTGKPAFGSAALQDSSAFAAAVHTHLVAQLSDASANGRSLISAADYAAMRVLLELVKGTSAGNIPVLDGSGKLDTSILPSLAITETFVVNSQAAMLALTAQTGDVAIRTDLNKSFILSTNSPGTLADWKELLTLTDAVLSVAGLTGAISGSALKTALAIAVADITDASANGRSLISAADYAAMRVLLSLVPGTNVQAYSALLASVAGLTTTGNAGKPVVVNAGANGFDIGASSSPGLVLINAVTASNQAAVQFTTGINNTYDEYEIHFQNALPVSNSKDFYFRTSTNGGSSFDSGATDYVTGGISYTSASGTVGSLASTGAPQIALASVVDNTAGYAGVSGTIRLVRPSAAIRQIIAFDTEAMIASAALVKRSAVCSRNTAADIDAVQFTFETGNIASGTFKLYGVRKV